MYSRLGVLVIGGTGLMGVPTVTRLLEAGSHVVVMSRGNTQGQGTCGCRPKLPSGAETLVGQAVDIPVPQLGRGSARARAKKAAHLCA